MSNIVDHTAGDKHAPGTVVRYSNGVIAEVQRNGSHRITGSSSAAAANARAAGRYSKALGPKAAARAFNKYYKERKYSSPRAKKAAMTRDLCHSKKSKYQRATTAYKSSRDGKLTGPGNYDYVGVDDGSRCPQNGGFEQSGAGCRFDSVKGKCLSSPSDRMDGRCEVGAKYMRKGKSVAGRCKKVVSKKSPKKAKKSPKKAKKSPKRTRAKGYDYYDPMEYRKKPGRKVKGAIGLAAMGYGGAFEQSGAGCRFDSVRGKCLSSPSSRMDGRCEVGAKYMRKGKSVAGRCKKVVSKKSPKKAKKSPKKAKKSPKRTRAKGYDYYDPMESRKKPGRKVKGAIGLAAMGYGGYLQ